MNQKAIAAEKAKYIALLSSIARETNTHFQDRIEEIEGQKEYVEYDIREFARKKIAILEAIGTILSFKREDYEAEFYYLLKKIPKVRKVSINNGIVSVFTDMICFKVVNFLEGKERVYKLGTFRFDFELDKKIEEKLKVANLGHPLGFKTAKKIAPGILEDGTPSGRLLRKISKYLEAGDIPAVIERLIKYFQEEAANSSDEYDRLYNPLETIKSILREIFSRNKD